MGLYKQVPMAGEDARGMGMRLAATASEGIVGALCVSKSRVAIVTWCE